MVVCCVQGLVVRVLVLSVEEKLVEGMVMNTFTPATLAGMVECLAGVYPLFRQQLVDAVTGNLRGDIRVAVNGKVYTDPGILIQPGSEVVFFPVIAGG